MLFENPMIFLIFFLRSWETLRNEMTPQIFSHGNFLAFAKFSSRQSFLVKFPSWHLFLPRKKQLGKMEKMETSILPGFFVWILPWHICLFCAAPLLEREFDLEKVPKLNVFFCPGSYLPLSPSHCCLLTFPRVWVIVITFSEVPNHLATSRGKSNIFGHENHPSSRACLSSLTLGHLQSLGYVNSSVYETRWNCKNFANISICSASVVLLSGCLFPLGGNAKFKIKEKDPKFQNSTHVGKGRTRVSRRN